MQGNVEVPDASAWGRRIFNEAEIDAVDEEELRAGFAVIADTEEGKRNVSCTNRGKLIEVGVWDKVYDSGIISGFLDLVKHLFVRDGLKSKWDFPLSWLGGSSMTRFSIKNAAKRNMSSAVCS